MSDFERPMKLPSGSKNRIRRFLWISIILFVSILFLINSLFFLRYKPVLDSTLKKWVLEESGGLYSIQFNSNSSQILLGKIVLENVQLKPNYTKIRALIKEGKTPCRLYLVNIKNIDVFFHDLIEIFWKKNLDIDLVNFHEPTFNIVLSGQTCPPETQTGRPQEFRKKPRILSINIQKLIVQSGKIHVLTPTLHQRPLAFSSSNINLDAGSIRWDNTLSENKSPLKILESVPFFMTLNNAQWISPEGHYQVLSKRVFYSNREGIMEIENGEGRVIKDTIPNPFPDKSPAGIHFKLKYIALNHFNWPALLLGESFEVDSVQIHTGELGIIDIHHSPYSKIYRPLPQEWLNKISMPIHIRTIHFKELNIHYEERNLETQKSGSLDFLHSNGEIQNIHNQTYPFASNDSVKIQWSSLFMGKGNLEMQISFHLGSPSKEFNVQAQIQNLPLVEVNSMTHPLAGIKVTGGVLNYLHFTMIGNQDYSYGNLRALYKNLRMRFLVQSKIKDPKKIKTLSALANTFLILNDNPLAGEKERISTYTYDRDPSRSFFNYLWKSVFTGLKPILGITAYREKSIYSFIQRLQEYQKWDNGLKPERKQHRELRRQKRLIRRIEKGLKNGILTPY